MSFIFNPIYSASTGYTGGAVGTYNVLEHGAARDGTGDLGAIINAAVTGGARTILVPYIPAGYRVATSIAMGSGVRIYGVNGRPVLKRAASTAVDMFGIYSKNDWRLEDLEIDGNSGNSGSGKGIYTNTCVNGTIRNLKVYGHTQDCLMNYAGSRLNVDGFEIGTTTLHGIYLDGHTKAIIRNVYANGCGGFPIYGTLGADHNQISHVHTDAAGLELITLFGDHNSINQVRATNCQDNGITLVGNYNELSNYTGYLNYHNGIHVNGNYNMLSNIVCYNNNQRDAGAGVHSGLKIESGYGGEAKGNQVSNVQLYDTNGSPTQNGGVTLGANGYNIWTNGGTITVANPFCYYGNNAYSSTLGVLGAVAPTHTSGTFVSGACTLTFLFTTAVGFHATDNLCTNIKYRGNKTANKIDNASSGTNSGF